MRHVATFLFTLLLAVGLVGCDSSDPAPTAQIRFMHASPGTGSVNVNVDGEQEATIPFSNRTTSPSVSDYVEVPVGAQTEISIENAEGTLLSTTAGSQNLEADAKYTFIVAGAASSQQERDLITLSDEFPDLESDQVGIRLVHGSGFAGSVDVYLMPPGAPFAAVDPLVSSFGFGNASGRFPGQFLPQPVSDQGSVLKVTPAGDTSNVALRLEVGTGNQGALPTQAGQYITGVAADDLSGTTPSVGALVHVDEGVPGEGSSDSDN